MINLYDHKIFIEDYKMEMVPLSVALQAVAEATNNSTKTAGPSNLNIEKYVDELESVMNELQNSVKNLNLDD